MTRTEYKKIESYMIDSMQDSAHDKLHIYRVLYNALEIAKSEPQSDIDIIIAASLLHDIGREAQSHDLNLCHAEIGSGMAYEFLKSSGWDEAFSAHVRDCVYTHRYRRDSPTETIEAKIIFDADKLDVSGAMGICRSLLYSGQILEPLYRMDDDGEICTEGTSAEEHSFLEEYDYKLRRIYDSFLTARGRELALQRQKSASAFYDALLNEITSCHSMGAEALESVLSE